MTDITSATEVMSTSWVKNFWHQGEENTECGAVSQSSSPTLHLCGRSWGGGVENPVDAILLKVFFDRPIICFNNICIQILNRCNQWFRN